MMNVDVAILAAQIERQVEEVTEKITDLLMKQGSLQAEISKLQSQRNDADADRLAELKEARKDAGRIIGLLAAHRTDLLDDLPIVTTASGALDVVAADLAKDGALVEKATAKLKKLTSTVNRAERLLVKITSFLKPLLI